MIDDIILVLIASKEHLSVTVLGFETESGNN